MHFALKGLGKHTLQPVTVPYQVAEGSSLLIMGQFQFNARIEGNSTDVTFPVIINELKFVRLSGDDEVEAHQLN